MPIFNDPDVIFNDPANTFNDGNVVTTGQSNVDLSQVMPSIFLKSPLLMDYMNCVSTIMNDVQDDIAGLYSLANPYVCPSAYLQNLADLIGLNLRSSTYLTNLYANSQQQQLINAVQWYKIKGTYASLQYIALLLGLNVKIRNFWCDNQTDYNNGIFVPEDYFVDTTGTSYPIDLTSSYFPTPHFGIYVLLNQVYGIYPSQYLWNDTPYPDLQYFTEQTRPVHTVPHYILEVDAQANESGGITEMSGNVIGAVTNWTYSTNYYDTNILYDNSLVYDNSYTTFLNSITNWAIGTGNINSTQPPLGIDTYTKLMLHLDNNLTDSETTPKTVTASGSGHFYSSQYIFGGYSYGFNGVDAYLSCGTSTDFNLTGDFTIDGWFQFTQVSTQQYLFSSETNVANRLTLFWDGTQNRFKFSEVVSGVVTDILIANYTLSINTWYHIAMIRFGNVWSLYINGVLVNSSTLSRTLGAYNTCYIGTYYDSGAPANFFTGYIDEYRVSNGIARWISNFTPPNHPYSANLGNQVSTGTGVLLKKGSGYNTFIAKIPQSLVQSGITEMMLYTNTGSPVFSAAFPSILKTSNEELDFFIQINEQ